jgi:hypothetical protein
MSLTSYRAALPRNLLVSDKADEDIEFRVCCKGFFTFFWFRPATGKYGLLERIELFEEP